MRSIAIRLAVAALCSALAACSSGTFAVVTVEAIGSPATPVHTIDLELTLAGKSAQTTLRDPSGADLSLPTDAALQIRSGSGSLGIVAIARDAAGAELGRGGGSVDVSSNKTTRVTIALDFTGGVVMNDLGVGDMASSAGASLAIDHQPSYDFGTVVVGSTSSAATFTVTNNGGSATGALGSATLGGANADQFTIASDGCQGLLLAAGASCTVTAMMRPTSAGTPAATISISATPGGTASTALSGTAVTPGSLSVTPSPVQFNAAVINGGTDDQMVTVTNTGGSTSGAVSLSVGGSDASMFTVTGGSCTSNPTLAPNGSCTATVRFAPTAAGMRAATLTANATPGGPGVTNLQGTGLTGSMLSFTTPPAFTTVASGSSATQFITLKNNGTQDSGPLGAPSMSGDTSFTVVSGGTCAMGMSVPGGMTCTYKIQFAPTTFGSKSAMISVTGTPGGTAMTTVSGTASQVFTLTLNTAGNGSGSVFIDGTACAAFPCTKMYTVTTGTTTASVTETPASTSTFSSWGVDCSGSGACGPTMNQDRSVTATFALKKINVTVNLTLVRGATGGVTASASPAGPALTCNATACTGQYDYGSTVTLTAAATGSNLFQSWAATPCSSRYSTTCGTGVLTTDFTTSVTFRPQVNYVFITSGTTMPNTFGSNFAGADLACDAAAKAGGLFNSTGTTPTHFKAWLSTGGAGGVSAKSRLGTARGWIRVDGLEFADDLVNTPTKIWYPPSLAEDGTLSVKNYAITGTLGDGTADWTSATSDNTCNNWTFPLPGTGTHYAQFGEPGSGPSLWTARQISVAGCTSGVQLYCFETAYNTAISPTAPATKRYAFVSTNAWTPTGGRGPGAGSADERCNLDKGSLPGTYVALLSTSTSPASDPSRLDPSGPVWVRPDGIVIASTTANLASGNLQAPINQQSDGTYLTNFNTVWTGSFVPNQTSGSAASDSCSDWSVSTGTADVAYAISIYRWFGSGSTPSCTTASRLYCLQQ